MAAILEHTKTPASPGSQVNICDHYLVDSKFEPCDDAAARKQRLGRLIYTYQMCDALNRNNRIYPQDICVEALDLLQERIKKKVVTGEVDHPTWLRSTGGIALREAAVKITKAALSGANITVEMDILPTEHGEHLESVLRGGVNPGVSQRAIGIWRYPTDADKERYSLPDNSGAEIYEYLRIITFDVVAEPGFADASNPTVTENQQQGAIMTPEEIKAKFPQAYEAIHNAGKIVGVAEGKASVNVNEAITAATPDIVKKATETLNTELTSTKTKLEKATKALEGFKPVLTELGIVNEQITDAQARSQVQALEAKNTELATKLATAESVAKTASDENNKFKADQARNTILEQVRASLKVDGKDIAHADAIFERVKAGTWTTLEQAQAIVVNEKSYIQKLTGGGGAGSNGVTNSNPANPGSGNESANGAGTTGSKANEAVAKALFGNIAVPGGVGV